MPGARWTSISHYARQIIENEDLTGARLTSIQAPWWNPPSLLDGARRRWWRQPAVRAASAGRFDVVHLTDQALGHHVHRFASCPTLVTCHDAMPWLLDGYFAGRIEGAVKRTLLRHSVRGMLSASHILCVSETTALDLVRVFGFNPSRITVIPNIAAALFEPLSGSEQALRGSGIFLQPRPRILSVGHAGPYKNLEWLIRALSESSLSGATLVRVGAPLTSAHRRLASALGVEERVQELGRIDDLALAHVYNSCDVLAQPSRYEGFGVPVIEAMACGLPVVCSDGGALPEVAAGAARVVPLDSGPGGTALAQALAEVIDDAQLRADLSFSGLERAERFRAEVVLPKVGDLYRRVANSADA